MSSIIKYDKVLEVAQDKVKDIYEMIAKLRSAVPPSYTYDPSNPSQYYGFFRAISSDMRYYEVSSKEGMIAAVVTTDVLKSLQDQQKTVPALIARGFDLETGEVLFELKEKNIGDLISYLNEKYGFSGLNAVHIDRFWGNNDPTDASQFYIVEYLVSAASYRTLIRVYKYSPNAASQIDFLESSANLEFVGERLIVGFLPGIWGTNTNLFYHTNLNNGLPYALLLPINSPELSSDEDYVLSDKNISLFQCDVDKYLQKVASDDTMFHPFEDLILFVDLKNIASDKPFNLIYLKNAVRSEAVPFFSDGSVVTLLMATPIPGVIQPLPTSPTSSSSDTEYTYTSSIQIAIKDEETGGYMLFDTGLAVDGMAESNAAESFLIGNLLMAPVEKDLDYPRFGIMIPTGVYEATDVNYGYVVLLYDKCDPSGDPFECIKNFGIRKFTLNYEFFDFTLGWDVVFASPGAGFVINPGEMPLTYGSQVPVRIESASLPTLSGLTLMRGSVYAVVEAMGNPPRMFGEKLSNLPGNLVPWNHSSFGKTVLVAGVNEQMEFVPMVYKLDLAVDFPASEDQIIIVNKVIQTVQSAETEYVTKDDIEEIRSELQSLEAQVSTLKESISQLAGKIGEIDNSVNELQEKLSDVEDKLSSLEAEIKAVQSDQSSNEDEIENIKQELNNLKSEVNQIKEELAVLENEEKRDIKLPEDASSYAPLILAVLAFLGGGATVLVSRRK